MLQSRLLRPALGTLVCTALAMSTALVATAQDSTPMASSAAATPMASSGMTIEVPLLDAKDQTVGLATFTEGSDGVTITVLMEGLTPGEHGWHLHEVGVCDPSGEKAFNSAGAHWNPTAQEHGAPDASSHHVGDFGNFVANEDGLAEASWTTADYRLGDGPNSVFDEDGTAIIIHAGKDDLTTQPSGDSGARFACGVVAAPTMMATPMAATPVAKATPIS